MQGWEGGEEAAEYKKRNNEKNTRKCTKYLYEGISRISGIKIMQSETGQN